MKVRKGFVSNSSSSSFLLVNDKGLDMGTREGMKRHIDWKRFYTHIVFAIKNEELVQMSAYDWSQMTGDKLIDILLKFYRITKDYLKDKTFEEAMKEVFDDDIVKKPIIPRFEEYRSKIHSRTGEDGSTYKITYQNDPDTFIWEEEDAFEDFSYHYKHYINNLKIHALYQYVANEEDPFKYAMLFSFGNDSEILCDAKEKGLITDYEYKFGMDIRYMNLLPVIFPRMEIVSYDYS